MRFSIFLLMAVLVIVGCTSGGGTESHFRYQHAKDRVDLWWDDQLITSYLYADSLQKPVFYPVISPEGFEFTRAFPLREKRGESTDHVHHIGIWFSYGEVNGVDFWTSTWENYNGMDPRHGKIAHQKVDVLMEDGKVRFSTISQWRRASGDTLMTERSEILIGSHNNSLIFDRNTTLFAMEDISFQDSKEGMYGIRVRTSLEENPSDTTKGAVYINSEGQKGADVWGQPAKWVLLKSCASEDPASILFIDHPENPGHPAHWMARGYGLFAVNPLGKGAYTNGRDSLNLKIAKYDSVTFRYRVVLTDSEVLHQRQILALVQDFK